MARSKEQLTAHMQRIAPSGGKRGGRARMERMTAEQRTLLAIKAYLGKAKGKLHLWTAGCTYRGKPGYLVMGCAKDPEKQFREVRKTFPAGVSVESMRVGAIKPALYLELVQSMRKRDAMAQWPVKPLIQVSKRGIWSDHIPHTELMETDALAKWLEPRRNGRPPKTR